MLKLVSLSQSFLYTKLKLVSVSQILQKFSHKTTEYKYQKACTIFLEIKNYIILFQSKSYCKLLTLNSKLDLRF